MLDAKWAGKIWSTYPNGDDAVLFLYAKYIEQYGWAWAEQFVQQNVTFIRGSNVPGDAVMSGETTIGVGSSGTIVTNDTSTVYITDKTSAWRS